MAKIVPWGVAPGGVIGYDVEGFAGRGVCNDFYLISR
jgi:hypothetical protein